MRENFEGFFGSRHSIKPKGEDVESTEYPGISEKGVELAKERAKTILEMMEKAKEGTVMALLGASDVVRTKSTAELFGDELEKLIKEQGLDEVEVLTRKEITEMMKEGEMGYKRLIETIVSRIEESPDKKFIVDAPLWLKEFDMAPWTDDEGGYSEYSKAILEKHNNDIYAALKDWIENKGKFGDLQGPDPNEIAENHLKGINRLRDFVSKHLPGRPFSVGAVGHSWNLDALAVYLANNGEVNLEGLEKTGVEGIKETESMQIDIGEDKAVFKYRDKEYPLEKGPKEEK